MPPTNYLAARSKSTTKPSNETTGLLEATRIKPKWEGKGRAKREKDLEAQTLIEQLDGQSNSRQKGGDKKKKEVAERAQEPEASSEAGPSRILSRGGTIVRYYQNSIVDDWPTSCTMITIVLALGTMTLLLIVFFGNLEIRRPRS